MNRTTRWAAFILVGAAGWAGSPSATAQPADDAAYFMSGGKKIPLQYVPDVVAYRGRVEAIRRPTGEYIPNVEGIAGDLSLFQREGYICAKVAAGKAAEVRATLRQGAPGANVQKVGAVARIPVDAPGMRGEPPVTIVPPEIVVRFKPEVAADQVKDILAKHKLEIVRDVPFMPNQVVARSTDHSTESAVRAANRLYGLKDQVDFSHPNLVFQHVTRANAPVTDPLFPAQWHLENTGQGGGVAGADVRARAAWQVTRGSTDVVVAVLDPDGVDYTHEDLVANLHANQAERSGIPGVDDDKNGYTDDIAGWNFATRTADPRTGSPHGTAAAALAVGRSNDLGGCGVAPNCRLLPVCVGGTIQDDADAFTYAYKMGADVISNSWGYPIGTPATDVLVAAITEAATQGRDKKGCVICFAMTNEKVDNFNLGGGLKDVSAHPHVVAVGRATNKDLWGHSGFGRGMAVLAPANAARGTPTQGCDPADLAGTLDIVTADLAGAAGYNTGNGNQKCGCNPGVAEHANAGYTNCFGGTSAATPITAGCCALVLSINPTLTAADVRDVIVSTADKVDAAAADYQPDDRGRKYSPTHGYGRVNALAAVTEAQRRANPAPPGGGPGAAAPAEPPELPIAAPVPEAREDVGGHPAIKVTVKHMGKPTPVYALTSIRALVLARAAGPQQQQQAAGEAERVAAALPKRFSVVRAKWADEYSAEQKALIVEAPPEAWDPLDEALAGLIERGWVRSVGRVVFFDKTTERSVSILTDEVIVEPTAPASKDKLRSMGFRTSTEFRFGKERVTLAPMTKGRDPLDFIARVEDLQDRNIVDPGSVQLQWVPPGGKRER